MHYSVPAFFLLLLTFGPTAQDRSEIRALWVDAFHAGIRSPEEVSQLVADAKRAHINTLIVQVRRRGDALYTKSFEPPLDDPAYDPGFDGLEAIITAAHHQGIEVHAWINAMPVWRDDIPPRDPRHVFNLHGVGKEGDENWLTRSPKGEVKFPVGYYLDPGHPAAAAYLVEVYTNIVRNYAIDGIHFDYIRYPETEARLTRGAPVGYNEVSLRRFRAATRRSQTPEPNDEQWTAWRRQQVTQLVRRVYIESKAINPKIKVSAATIAWGRPPTDEDDFLDASPGQRIFQDWHGWMKEGILDIAIPMNYARENDPTVQGWFDGWIRWEKRHKHGRKLAVGIGAYLNSRESNLAQMARIRKSDGGSRADGVSFFSYANMFAPAGASTAPSAQVSGHLLSGPERVGFLVEGANGSRGPFAAAAPPPALDWIDQPKVGWVAGSVSGPDGMPTDGARVSIRKPGWWPFRRTLRTITDGNGYFGFAGLTPGRYNVALDGPKNKISQAQLEVTAGRVSRLTMKE